MRMISSDLYLGSESSEFWPLFFYLFLFFMFLSLEELGDFTGTLLHSYVLFTTLL